MELVQFVLWGGKQSLNKFTLTSSTGPASLRHRSQLSSGRGEQIPAQRASMESSEREESSGALLASDREASPHRLQEVPDASAPAETDLKGEVPMFTSSALDLSKFVL
jgi:hypothetical protein